MSAMSPLTSEFKRLEANMARWRGVVIATRPGVNPEYVTVLCREIVNRAQLLAQTWPGLKMSSVAEFLLRRSEQWVFEGIALDKIGGRLPKDLSDLGALKIAEGGRDGGPLSKHELKQVKRIIQ